jgi:hypothetical protein
MRYEALQANGTMLHLHSTGSLYTVPSMHDS